VSGGGASGEVEGFASHSHIRAVAPCRAAWRVSCHRGAAPGSGGPSRRLLGALITPTLADFESELARGPGYVRQSSDSA
jgi:hypothetical protein